MAYTASPHCKNTGAHQARRPRRENGARNFPSAKRPRNPLKKLIPDERIQGNPRKSKPRFRAFRGKIAMVQENPNGEWASASREALQGNRGIAVLSKVSL